MGSSFDIQIKLNLIDLTGCAVWVERMALLSSLTATVGVYVLMYEGGPVKAL